MPRPARVRAWGAITTLFAGLLLANLSCSSLTGPDKPDVSLQLSTVSANTPSILADGITTSVITVVLVDEKGTAYGESGGPVEMTSTAGSLSAVSDLQNGSYTATLTSSTVAGVAVVSARLDGAQFTDTATVTFTPGAPATLTVANSSSNGQTAVAGSTVPNPPSVKVADANGNGVPGISVTFAVTAGGGSITGAVQQTNAEGIATVGSWRLGTSAGTNTLTATITTGSVIAQQAAVDIVVTFTATAVAGAPASIASNGGDGQTAAAGTPVATAPSVKLLDANANPVGGATVTFAVAGGGGSVTGATATTNAAGIATVGSWTLGNTAGPNALSAATAGVASAVTFNATGIPGPPAILAIASAAANNQAAAAGSPVVIPPSVRVTDAHGNGVAGVGVTFAVASGGGSITGADAVTNSSGIATVGSWTLGTTAGVNTLTASAASLSGSPVTFTATGTSGAAGAVIIVAGDGQTAVAGSAVSVRPSVRVTDVNGNAVEGTTVTFTVTAGDGSVTGATSVSDASGIATVGSWILGTTAGVNRLAATAASITPAVFTATGVAGAPAHLAIHAGNNQSAAIGEVVAIPPAVRITDANGNAVAGVAVAFAVASGGGSVTGATPTTDADGVAAVGSWKLGTSVGGNTLTATSGSLTGSPATFTATATAGVPGIVSVQAGDNQTAIAGSTVSVAPAVKVTTTSGIALAGVTVTFAVSSGSGSVTGAQATTNADGIATVGSWRLGNVAGTNSLTATVEGVAPVTFTATGIPGAAAAIAINAGNNQTASISSAVAIAPSVRVSDANGNAVAGATVTFVVVSGGGSVTGGTATSNALGIATVGSWTLGSAAGTNTLTATLSGVPAANVTFSATGVETPPLIINVQGRLERGQTVTISVTQSGAAFSPSSYTLSLDPADGAQVNGDGTMKLLKAGSLGITANVGSGTGNTTITVARPPLVVFDCACDGSRQIWQVALDGGDLVQLTNAGSDNQHPSRVGDRLVYSSARNSQIDIFSMAVSTGVETNLTPTGGIPERNPLLSPNGQRIVFVSQHSGEIGRARFMNADGTGVTLLTTVSANDHLEISPSWSPGSDKVIFSSNLSAAPSTQGSIDLWISQTPGSTSSKLPLAVNSPGAELDAVWNSANQVLFHRNNSGSDEIWITTADGTSASKVTDGTMPAWTSDGRIVFVRNVGGQRTLYWLDPANPGVINPISIGPGDPRNPSVVLGVD